MCKSFHYITVSVTSLPFLMSGSHVTQIFVKLFKRLWWRLLDPSAIKTPSGTSAPFLSPPAVNSPLFSLYLATLRCDGTVPFFALIFISFTSVPWGGWFRWVYSCMPTCKNIYTISNYVNRKNNTYLYESQCRDYYIFCGQTDVHGSIKSAYLAHSHSHGLRPCLHWVTITPFILLLPLPMFWFLLKVLCQCPPSRVPLPCMLIELCIFYYCCQGKIRDTFSKGALRGQWTQRGVLLLLHYQSSSHLNGAGLWSFSSLSSSLAPSLSLQ